MALEDDFPADVALKLKKELEDFSAYCYYDPRKRRIVYYDPKKAMEVYMSLQIGEMNRHKWLESERAHKDLGESALLDWDRKFAPNFCGFWRKTHQFIPVKTLVKS